MYYSEARMSKQTTQNTRSGGHFDRLAELAKQLGHVMDRFIDTLSDVDSVCTQR